MDSRCPCCRRPVPPVASGDVELEFRAFLGTNDLRRVFHITGDRRLIVAPDVQVDAAAIAFLDALDRELERREQQRRQDFFRDLREAAARVHTVDVRAHTADVVDLDSKTLEQAQEELDAIVRRNAREQIERDILGDDH